MLGCLDILSGSIVFSKAVLRLHGEYAEVSWFSDFLLVKTIPAELTKTIINQIMEYKYYMKNLNFKNLNKILK